MSARFLISAILVWSLAGGISASAQSDFLPAGELIGSTSTAASTQSAASNERFAPTPKEIAGIIERFTARERGEQEAFSAFKPIIETYIQEETLNAQMGTVPKSDFYFLGQADFRNRLKVHSLVEGTHTRSLIWSFNQAGFLQMIFPDRGEFDKDHYNFTYVKREFLGEVRCLVFDVDRAQKARGPRFRGRIWVEDQDDTIVRFNGVIAPEIRFSVRQFADEYYLHFDSWRLNSKAGLWVPAYVYSQNLDKPAPFGVPLYKSQTRIWGYGVTQVSHEEELNRLLIESPNEVKDEEAQHDRSPLEQQREWRREAANNVFDVLERDGLVARKGDVEKTLNTIVNNLIVSNNLENQVDLNCRVLMTSNLEMFSMQDTVVVSRGLIDVVPNEETLAALLAYEVADAMVPKPAEDQYGFSDILRLKPTEVMKRLSFADNKTEAVQISEKAIEIFKKSPYAGKAESAGLFFSQLQWGSKNLRQLISPRLGNRVFFTSELLHAAPALQMGNMWQIAALPMGSRIKVNPWNDSITMMKTQPMAPISPREKMPFEVTPIIPYLTRYTATAAAEHGSKMAIAKNQ
ncbi:MAG: hypothetical protein ACRD51_02635 [Candidatus Acidiferrum sp.]